MADFWSFLSYWARCRDFAQNHPGEVVIIRSLKSRNIFDAPIEDRFNRISQITQRLFDVPISLVSIVDENRQWFKSHLVLDVRENPRELSFCGHTILGEEILVVEDSLKDQNFRDNPLITGEPKIRFYVGCPLRDSKGLPLGALCILDNKSSKLSAPDLEIFSDLAHLVELEIAGLNLATID